MTRVLTGLVAWLAGTALAVSLAWFGANMVVRDAGVTPGVQVINADPTMPTVASPTPPAPPTPPASPTARASDTPAASDPAPSAAASGSPSPSASATPSAPASESAGHVRSYTLTGGRVTLLVSGDSVALVTAVPDPGFSVQNWSGTDWLRVDFGSGTQVSSLIASWYLHTPTITVTN